MGPRSYHNLVKSYRDARPIVVATHGNGNIMFTTLQWRHNGRDGVSNHQPHNCLLNRVLRNRWKKTIKAPRHWLLWGEFIGHRWIPLTKGQLHEKCFHLMTSSCRFSPLVHWKSKWQLPIGTACDGNFFNRKTFTFQWVAFHWILVSLPDSTVREFGALHVHILCAENKFPTHYPSWNIKILIVPIAHMRNAQVLGLFCRIEYGVAVFLQHCSTYILYSSDFIQPQVKSPSMCCFGRKFSLSTYLCSVKMVNIYRQINISCFSNVILLLKVLSPQPDMMIWLDIEKFENVINCLYRFSGQIFVP